MRKLSIILITTILIQTVLLSNEVHQKERLNNYITTFQLQKITYNNTEGFFIPFTGYQQLLLVLNDYIYCQDILILKDERIKQLERFEKINFRLKTALGISISFDVGAIFLCAGMGILCYGLARDGL